jgi:DNA-binding CsgD family transcriptional regulator
MSVAWGPDLDDLSPREREVLALVAEAKTNARIADELVLTGRTVESHVRSIFMKLGIKWDTGVDRRVAVALMYVAGGQQD